MTTIISFFLDLGVCAAAVALDHRMILHTGGCVLGSHVSSVYLIDTVSSDITPKADMNTKRW